MGYYDEPPENTGCFILLVIMTLIILVIMVLAAIGKISFSHDITTFL